MRFDGFNLCCTTQIGMFCTMLFLSILFLFAGRILNRMVTRISNHLSAEYGISYQQLHYVQYCLQACPHIKFIPQLINILTFCLSMFVFYRFGVTIQMAAALLFTWALIVLSFIDIKYLLLPDAITQPMLWLGLGLSIFPVFESSDNTILGTILGYGCLWMVYWLFKWFTQKEGMGHGDFKLSAMIGAWLGISSLPFVLVFSSLTATVVGICLMFCKKIDKNTPLPFGPFLAAGGWLGLLFGDWFG